MLKNGHFIKQFISIARIIACLVEFKLPDTFRIYSFQPEKNSYRESGIFQIPNSWSWQVASCKLYGELLIVVWQSNKSKGFILSSVLRQRRVVPHIWSTPPCKYIFAHWALIIKTNCILVHDWLVSRHCCCVLPSVWRVHYSDDK